LRPTFLSPLCRDLLKPPCAAATLSSFARLPPVRAALPRRYADPRSASRRSGDGRPRFGHGPAAGAAWRGLRRGLAIPRPAVIPTHFVVGVHGWAPGGARSRCVRSPPPRALPSAATRACALRAKRPAWRSAGFFAAFCRALWPCGLRVGARAYSSFLW